MTRQQFAVIAMAISRDAGTWCGSVLTDSGKSLDDAMDPSAIQRFADQISDYVTRLDREVRK